MPGHRTPAAASLGGAISRRHAELLLRSGGGSVSVKDLRLRRVVPPASASLESSPECAAAAAAKPGSVESPPPEAATADELERKPVLPRSKLVRDPGSFGYRRLLPFLNQMAKNDGKGMPSENTAASSAKELNRFHLGLVDESASGSHRESDPVESVEPVVVKTGGDPEMKDGCNNVREETNTAPHDLASSKAWLIRCTRSRFVHHPSSFSYKRMLPFLMENEIYSQEGERVKIRRVAEERQVTSDEDGLSASGEYRLAASEDSSKECNRAQNEIMEGRNPSEADGNVLYGRLLQPAIPKASPPERSATEVQNVTQLEGLTSNQDPLISYECESTSDGDDTLADGQRQLAASEDSSEECNRDEVKIRVQDKADGDFVLDGRKLQPAVSEVSPLEDSTTLVQKAAQAQPLTPDGIEENSLTSDKGELLAKEQLQLSVTKELLTAQQHDSTEFTEVQQQCQSSESGCPDVGFGSPTKAVISLLLRNCALEHPDAVASLDNDPLQMICRPSDPCTIDKSLSVEEMSGCVQLTESGSSKAGILQPRIAHSTEKRGLSPKKLSPRKGILKRHTRGCKGICACLDCSTFRLRADRAFEFSRKQMQEADDIIGNLLNEVANLRSLVEKPTGQRESTQSACRRASQVEEVARDRCRQMFLDLNSHCRIPGPRVKFEQYVEEKMAASPDSRNQR
ncbi:uncharacterized protein LOC133908685 [Phragmites australis]|uniref:uncharacterized protein LOC133908685 n=1 Tax=Phragmites australis TaxID=29695 RepID=UPI002D79A3E0|nr:uncharacterized protein LOC133908685 [Phragmites australis]